jgi:hypothetical protein
VRAARAKRWQPEQVALLQRARDAEAKLCEAVAMLEQRTRERDALAALVAEAEWLIDDASDTRYDGHEVWNERRIAWAEQVAAAKGGEP